MYFARAQKKKGVRLIGGVVMGTTFWTVIFLIFYRVLIYFQRTEILGDLLAMKLLNMIIVTFFFVLMLSNLIIGLSKFYLARDLNFLYSLPISAREIFTARFWEVSFDASWMVLLFGFPVFLSYGIVYEANVLFYGLSILALITLCVIASGTSSAVILLTGAVLPAGRLKAGISLFTVLAVVALVIAVRLLRPEQLVNPDQFASVAFYLSSLEVASNPILPTSWTYDVLRLSLKGGPMPSIFLNLSLGLAGAGTLIYLGGWLADKYLIRGFSLAETVKRKSSGASASLWPQKLPLMPPDMKAFFSKELKTFLRDQSQWPQLVLIIVLVAIYLYNFSVLPLEKSPIQTVYLQNVFSFLNIGLTAFVLTALAARFVYPAVSLEGKAFWIVLSSPMPLRRFLWFKFFFYLVPLLFLSELLIVCSNILLEVTPLMMIISSGTILFVVPMITALALTFGAHYPSFNHENPVETVTSFGGILYMMVSSILVGCVIVIEAGPVYHLCTAAIRGGQPSFLELVWASVAFSIIPFLSLYTVVLSLRRAEHRLITLS